MNNPKCPKYDHMSLTTKTGSYELRLRTVTMSGTTLTDLLSAFEGVLRAHGYSFDGNLDIVDDSLNDTFNACGDVATCSAEDDTHTYIFPPSEYAAPDERPRSQITRKSKKSSKRKAGANGK